MSITLDASSISTYQAATSSYSFTHTCSGVNRLLIVGVSLFVSGGVSGITYNGVALTKIRSDTTGTYSTELWYLVNPATGTNSIAVTLSGALTSISEGFSLNGVDQIAPISSNAGTNGTGAISQNNIVTVEVNDWAAGNMSCQQATATVNGGTQDQQVTGVLGTGAFSHLGPVASPSTVGLGWSYGGTTPYAQSGAAIKPLVIPWVQLTNDPAYQDTLSIVPY